MSFKKIKIFVFTASFILFILLLCFVDLSKKVNYYNIDHYYNDSLTVQINFGNNPNLDRTKLQLYYSDSINTISPYSKDHRTHAPVKNNSAKFKYFTKDIPKLIRINFDREIKDTITIDQIFINLVNKKIDIDLTNFIAHPSINILKKKSNLIKIELSPNKNIEYDPYIYLEKPIYVHKLKTIEYILILIIILILSYLISELSIYLINFKPTTESFNTILLFLLLISLLFREHWISKTLILIGVYTVFLSIKKKIKFKKINFYSFLFFFIFAVISLIWSQNIERSFSKLIGFLPFILIPVWLSFFNSKIKYNLIFKYVGIVFAFISFGTILLAFFRFNSTQQITEFYYHKLASPLFTNAIYISILYLMIFLFNLYLLIKKKEKIQIIDYITLTVLFFYILLLSSKLIAVLLFITTIIVGFSSFNLQFKTQKLTLSIILIMSLLTLFIIKSNNNISKRFDEILNIEKVKEVYSKNEFGDTYLWNGLNLRLFQLRAFYDIEKNDNFNSFLGVGLNNGQALLNERYKSYKLYTGKKWEENGGYLSYNFHNQYAQTLIELGVIGFLLLIYIFYGFFLNAKNNKNFLLFSVVFIFILVMFTESILVRQKGIMFFVLFPIIAIKIGHFIEQKRLL